MTIINRVFYIIPPIFEFTYNQLDLDSFHEIEQRGTQNERVSAAMRLLVKDDCAILVHFMVLLILEGEK